VDIRFLRQVSTERFTAGDSPKEIAKKIKDDTFLSEGDKKRLAAVGEKGVIGLDVAGPEKGEFTLAGMKRFELMYGALASKAKNLVDGGALVFRIHAGEGDPIRDASGNFASGSNHRDIAQNNVGHILDTIEGMSNNGLLSDKVILRIGHATHASPAQLEKIRLLESKGVKIHVEANLTSNIVTGSVANGGEQAQVLLRFLQHGVTPTLNTDGGGVYGTTLKNEYRVAQDIIGRFKDNETAITEGNKKYYYSELPSPDKRDSSFEYHLISSENRANFDINQIKNETETYQQEVLPKIHQGKGK
jgi:Adenosine deaminase